MHEQILAETNYAREADNLTKFAEALRPLRFVEVPRLYPELSGDKVLTMSRLDGSHLDAFLADDPPQRLRDRVGEHLFELLDFQVLRLEALHAEPHWGNYLLRPDGGVGLVDFGSVKYLPAPFAANLRAAFLSDGSTNSDEFTELLRQRYALTGQPLTAAGRKALVHFSEHLYRRVYPPARALDDTPFDFSDATFLAEYMQAASGLARVRASLPEYVFFARAEIGLYQTLHRLRARVRTSKLVRRYLTP